MDTTRRDIRGSVELGGGVVGRGGEGGFVRGMYATFNSTCKEIIFLFFSFLLLYPLRALMAVCEKAVANEDTCHSRCDYSETLERIVRVCAD